MLLVVNGLFTAKVISVIFVCSITGGKCDVIRQGSGSLPPPLSLLNLLSNILSAIEATSYGGRRNFGHDRVIKDVIYNKLRELQPYMQDDDDDKMILRDDQKGIVNRLNEKDIAFKNRVQKYRSIRESIYEKLTNESISQDAKDFIINTVDLLIGKVINSKSCELVSVARTPAGETPPERPGPSSHTLAWKDEWENIKIHFVNSMLEYSNNLQGNPEMSYKRFLNHFIRLFQYISKDLKELPNRFKIECDSSKKFIEFRGSHRKYSEDKDETTCDYFRVCSHELKEFMLDLYEKVNQTAVSVIDNYIEMYNLDVNEEKIGDKEKIKAILKDIRHDLEEAVPKIFMNETTQFKLDVNKNKEANMKAISHYIRQVINKTKRSIRNALIKKFNETDSKKSVNIKIDVKTNSEMELGNLAEELVEGICYSFGYCNKVGRAQADREQDSQAETQTSAQLAETPETTYTERSTNSTSVEANMIEVNENESKLTTIRITATRTTLNNSIYGRYY